MNWQTLSTLQLLSASLFARWHVRRMPPPADAEERREQLRWCRDHCQTFAGRWFALAALFWLIFSLPFQTLKVPLLGIAALLAFSLGIYHLVWHIWAQDKVGPPPIEPPVDFTPPEHRERHRK